jgi:hypothetical protein
MLLCTIQHRDSAVSSNMFSPIGSAARGEKWGHSVVHFVLKAKVEYAAHFFPRAVLKCILYGNGSHGKRVTVTPDRAVPTPFWALPRAGPAAAYANAGRPGQNGQQFPTVIHPAGRANGLLGLHGQQQSASVISPSHSGSSANCRFSFLLGAQAACGSCMNCAQRVLCHYVS